MENLRQQFIQETSTFAANWYNQTSLFYITKYQQITANLDAKKIGQMKIKVNHIINISNLTIKKELSKPNIWWNQDPKHIMSLNEYSQLGNKLVGKKYPKTIDHHIRVALGELGVILEEFGYNICTRKKILGREFWFQDIDGQGYQTCPYFPHLLEWSEEMEDTLMQYNDLFKRAIVLQNEIQNVNEERKRLELINSWESIVT